MCKHYDMILWFWILFVVWFSWWLAALSSVSRDWHFYGCFCVVLCFCLFPDTLTSSYLPCFLPSDTDICNPCLNFAGTSCWNKWPNFPVVCWLSWWRHYCWCAWVVSCCSCDSWPVSFRRSLVWKCFLTDISSTQPSSQRISFGHF